jgi:TonB family protein
MNAPTIDDSAKRQFFLPAAFVLSAYAVLFFGFISHPPLPFLSPPASREQAPKPFELSVSDPNSGQENNNPAIESLRRPQLPEPPVPAMPAQPNPVVVPLSPIMPGGPVGFGNPYLPGDPTGPITNVGPRILDPLQLDHHPQVMTQIQPAYPFEAKIRSENGKVVVEFVVSESGHVLNPHVTSSSDPVFEEPTLQAIKQWRFAPGTWHGVPVRFRMSVPVVFHLDE